MNLVLSRGAVAIVDDDLPDEIASLKWSLDSDGYAVHTVHATVGGRKQEKMSLHRVIAGARSGQQVDHINHNKLDNRRCNLRSCTCGQNLMNALKRGGTSRYKGVSVYRRKWKVSIAIDRKHYHLGYFPTEESAARAYDAKAKELFGEFACLNFPPCQPG